MKSTLHLPPELLAQAQEAAARIGMALPDWVQMVLRRELGTVLPKPVSGKPVQFPLFASAAPGKLKLTPADLAVLQLAEDRRQYGIAD